MRIRKLSGPESAGRWISLVCGLWLVLTAVQLAAVAAGNVRPQMALRHSHVRANAQVIGVRWEEHDLGRRKGRLDSDTLSISDPRAKMQVCFVRFHFTDHGRDIEREVEAQGVHNSDPAAPLYHVGDALPVVYRPNHPEYAVEDTGGSIWGPIVAPAAISLLLLIFGAALLGFFCWTLREPVDETERP